MGDAPQEKKERPRQGTGARSKREKREKESNGKQEKPHSGTIDRLRKSTTMLRQRRTTANSAQRTRDRNERARSKHIESMLSVEGRNMEDELNVVITGKFDDFLSILMIIAME